VQVLQQALLQRRPQVPGQPLRRQQQLVQLLLRQLVRQPQRLPLRLLPQLALEQRLR
jgi:hypothetical protein